MSVIPKRSFILRERLPPRFFFTSKSGAYGDRGKQGKVKNELMQRITIKKCMQRTGALGRATHR